MNLVLIIHWTKDLDVFYRDIGQCRLNNGELIDHHWQINILGRKLFSEGRENRQAVIHRIFQFGLRGQVLGKQ